MGRGLSDNGGRRVSGDPRFKHIDQLLLHLDLGRENIRDIGYQFRHARSYSKQIPLWANNDTEVRNLLKRTFPKMDTSQTQRDAAGNWFAIIHFYYRMGYTAEQTAHEIGSTTLKVHDKIRSMNRAARGVQSHSGKPRSIYGRGKHPNCRRKPKSNVIKAA